MAKDKRSVVVYTDLIHTFEELTDAQAGRLIKHFFRYVNDQNPKCPDKLTKIAFEPIRQQLKRDLTKWEATRVKRSEAGKISAFKKQQNSTNSTHVEQSQQTSTKSTVNDNVIVNVNDNVTSNTVYKDKRISDFLTNQIWKEEFCMAKSLQMAQLEKFQQEFVSDTQLKGEFVDSYPKYFTNWFNKNKHGTHKQTINHARKGTSEARTDGLKGWGK
jgi:hypothetical protein